MFHDLAGRRLLPRIPKPVLRRLLGLGGPARSRAQRLAMFPRDHLPLEQPATIRWNAQLVPFIEAGSDRDLAFCLGMVHAHLREAQLEFLKMLAFGRLAEFLGPLAIKADHAIRIADFAHAAAAIEAGMPEPTRIWTQAYVDGLNHYWQRVPERAPELRLLARGHEPWTIRDVCTVGRLIGADFYWLTYFALLRERGKPGFAELWRRVRAAGEAAAEPFGPGAGPAAISSIFASVNRAGSNSVAVAPSRSATGGALIASDPHLGMSLPNLWLLAGLRSPSLEAVGMTLPGIPIMALGRNPDLAWGGTNLRAASTDLYEVSHLGPEAIERRTVSIRARGWPTAKREVRRCAFGPILSDTSMFPGRPGETIAFRWVGHETTDEITAFLGAARARNPEELCRAFKGYGLTPLNLIFADRQGNIGHLLAVTQPVRGGFPESDLVLDAADPGTAWQGFVDATQLPVILNPPEGYIASANNRPRSCNVPIGFLFGVESRLRRLGELIERQERLTPADLQALQADTGAPEAATLAHTLAELVEAAGAPQAAAGLLGHLHAWNGSYDADSRAAVAFELLLFHLVPDVTDAAHHAGLHDQVGQWSQIASYLLPDLAALPREQREATLRRAAAKAAADLGRFASWGEMHRLKIAHFLAQVPVIGEAFVLEDIPVGGSRQTPMKTAHGLVGGRHHATLGSMARHVSDMADPDANWFLLLGGQDGWFGAENFADQVPLWREGRYIQMPLTQEAVARSFPDAMALTPGPSLKQAEGQ